MIKRNALSNQTNNIFLDRYICIRLTYTYICLFWPSHIRTYMFCCCLQSSQVKAISSYESHTCTEKCQARALRKVNKLWSAINSENINRCAHDDQEKHWHMNTYVCTNVSCIALFRYVHMCVHALHYSNAPVSHLGMLLAMCIGKLLT